MAGYNLSKQQRITWSTGSLPHNGQNLTPEEGVLHSSLMTNTTAASNRKDRGLITSRRVENVPHSNLTALLHPIRMEDTLELAHIPKTGGTAVELAGARGGIPWSYCHFYSKFIPVYISATTGNKNLPECPTSQPGITEGMADQRIYNKYHAPPCFFQKSFYLKAAVFGIVRNPYDRIISGFFYNARLSRKFNRTHKEMNEWIHRMLKPMKDLPAWRAQWLCSSQMPTKYFALGGHLIPQYDFIFGTASRFEDRTVHHILKFEDPEMHTKFAQLMRLYRLESVVLPPIPRHRKDNLAPQNPPSGNHSSTWHKRSHKWLSPENVQLIQQIYEDDFKAFGYPMEIR